MNIVIPHVAVPLAQVPSVGTNSNMTEVATKFNTYAVQTDIAKTITVTHQWNATQQYAGDILFSDALYDIGKSGATRPRHIYASGNIVAGGTITGTLATGAQPNVTSLGLLSHLDATGAGPVMAITASGGTSGLVQDLRGSPNTGLVRTLYSNLSGNLVLGIEGSVAQGLFVGTSAYESVIGSDVNQPFGLASNSTVRLRLTAAGAIQFTLAASKLIAGATSWSLRNSVDSADNLKSTDAGIVNLRGVSQLAGAVAGDLVLANAKAIRGENAGQTNTLPLIKLNAAGRVEIDSDAQDIQFGTNRPALGGGATPTFGTIGGSGPTVAAQNAWFKFFDAAGVACFIPFWK
jgi:hypothetical protein